MEIPDNLDDYQELTKKILPDIKRKMLSMNLNEAEKKHVLGVLESFYNDHTLHVMGLSYVNAYEKLYRGSGPPEKRMQVSCPNCKSNNTMELIDCVTEVFKRPPFKGTPGYERMQKAPKITRKWKEIDSRGNSKEVYAEYQAIAYTHDCMDCNSLFSYPNTRIATEKYYRQGHLDDAAKRAADIFGIGVDE